MSCLLTSSLNVTCAADGSIGNLVHNKANLFESTHHILDAFSSVPFEPFHPFDSACLTERLPGANHVPILNIHLQSYTILKNDIVIKPSP